MCLNLCNICIYCFGLRHSIDNHDSGYLGMAVQLYVRVHLGHLDLDAIRVCEFTGLECENGVLEWNTGVEYWSIQTESLHANIANQDTHQV